MASRFERGGTAVVIGGQYGDEGKGKIIDALVSSGNYQIVARGNGGPNAGHNIYDVASGIAFAAHLMPSGIFKDGVLNVIGQGTVINPASFLHEMAQVEEILGNEIDPSRLMISGLAHVILPSHRAVDRASDKVGSTGQGIGPAYRDKASRLGIRLQDILGDAWREVIEGAVERHYQEVAHTDLADELEFWDVQQIKSNVEALRKYIGNPAEVIHEACINNDGVVVEGAQAVLLDINYGTYPFVTSSSTGGLGVASGVDGLLPTSIRDVIGVFKLPMTRVGKGPFVTRLTDEEAEIESVLAGVKGQPGAEFGATTGRKRSIGWFDAVAGSYAVRHAGITQAVFTKLDCYDGLEEIKVCQAYKQGDTIHATMPLDARDLEQCIPVYGTFTGWDGVTSGVKEYSDLPLDAVRFIEHISHELRVPLLAVGTGYDREDLVYIPQ